MKIGVVLSLALTLIITFGVLSAHSTGDDHEIEEYLNSARKKLKRLEPAVATPVYEAYTANCSDCHLAYSPNLLPARSWEKMMEVDQLENHFEEYVSLEEEDRIGIRDFLVANSAEKSTFKLPKKTLRSIPSDQVPLRIREVKAIFRLHDIIPDKYTIHNQNVISLSQCNACHQQVDKGVLDEDDVFIPYQPMSMAE